jgi:hypothetical protein
MGRSPGIVCSFSHPPLKPSKAKAFPQSDPCATFTTCRCAGNGSIIDVGEPKKIGRITASGAFTTPRMLALSFDAIISWIAFIVRHVRSWAAEDAIVQKWGSNTEGRNRGYRTIHQPFDYSAISSARRRFAGRIFASFRRRLVPSR